MVLKYTRIEESLNALRTLTLVYFNRNGNLIFSFQARNYGEKEIETFYISVGSVKI